MQHSSMHRHICIGNRQSRKNPMSHHTTDEPVCGRATLIPVPCLLLMSTAGAFWTIQPAWLATASLHAHNLKHTLADIHNKRLLNKSAFHEYTCSRSWPTCIRYRITSGRYKTCFKTWHVDAHPQEAGMKRLAPLLPNTSQIYASLLIKMTFNQTSSGYQIKIHFLICIFFQLLLPSYTLILWFKRTITVFASRVIWIDFLYSADVFASIALRLKLNASKREQSCLLRPQGLAHALV